jgi:hypothetical protein
MGAIGGFVVGYLLGTRAGRRGLEELVEAWGTIRRSEEVRALLGGVAGHAKGLVERRLRAV